MSRLDFLYRTKLPHRAVAVYIYLADRTNENNECRPAIPTIASDLKLSPSTVRRWIRDLKKAGPLAIEQRTEKRRQEQSAVPAESGVKKAKRSAKGQLRSRGSQKAIQLFGERRSNGADELLPFYGKTNRAEFATTK